MASPALWLYRALVTLAVPLALPWALLSARLRGKHRPPLAARLGRRLPPLPRGGVWVQAVSVGEVAVATPLLAELRRRHPDLPLVLSATTATGLAVATGQQSADVVLPFPLDLPGPVRRCLDAATPRLVILVETELWPELLDGCRRRGIPVALVNARISDSSFRGYRAARRLVRPLLTPVTLALAQEEQDAIRLVELGVPAERVAVTGNIKFDSPPPATRPALADEVERLAAGRPVLVAASTMPGEEEVVLAAWSTLPVASRPFLLLAPRHPERAAIALELLSGHDITAVRRTRLGESPRPCDALVLDTVGELAALYSVAAIALVGGSLVPTGGHNPIEPARFAVPVLTGPHVRNFSAVYRRFTEAGAVRVVHDAGELGAALAEWLAEPDRARAAGRAGQALLAANTGATARVADALERFLA